MANSFAPPQPLRLSTAGRMLGETELLDALQRGARQAFAFLDGKWGSIPSLWWYRFTDIDWRRQRVTFTVDGRAIEATETVIDMPPPEREERKDFVEKLTEKLEHDRLTKAMKAALEKAADTAEPPSKSDTERERARAPGSNTANGTDLENGAPNRRGPASKKKAEATARMVGAVRNGEITFLELRRMKQKELNKLYQDAARTTLVEARIEAFKILQ